MAYKGIVLAIRGLWNQDGVRSSSCFHEVMQSNICHDLCARINFGVELLLQLPQRLYRWLISNVQRQYPGTW